MREDAAVQSIHPIDDDLRGLPLEVEERTPDLRPAQAAPVDIFVGSGEVGQLVPEEVEEGQVVDERGRVVAVKTFQLAQHAVLHVFGSLRVAPPFLEPR